MPGVSVPELYAIDSLLSPAERDVRDTVSAWGQRIAAEVPGWYERGQVPARELAAELGALGLLGMHLDGYGCAGASAVEYGMACYALEAIDSGVRSLASVQGSLAMTAIHAFGSEEQKARWLPAMADGERIGCFGLTEADFGSNPAGMRTRAVRDGADWLLTGTKTWITNGSVADVAVIWAQVADDTGRDRVHGFCVPTDSSGFTSHEITGKLSLRASVTAELVLDGVRLPADALLPGAVGLSSALHCLNEARFGIVFGTMGAAADCVEVTRRYAGTREVFGRPLSAFQLTQAKLADLALLLGNGLLLAVHLGRLKEIGTLTPAQVSTGKLNNARSALAIARECRTILGANGITGDYPVLRHASNLESVLTYEGTSEVHALIVGQALTGIPAFD